jgi:chromosome partitioning protein
MVVPEGEVRPASAHVVVLGNEKGGSGKSTIAMHVAVALLNFGQRVATVDLDSRQKTFTRYIDNRHNWGRRGRLDIRVPTHFCIARAATRKLDENEAIEVGRLADAIASIEQSHDFVVIDTPGADTHLVRLVHSFADTLITPLNDSFVDFDVLGSVDPVNLTVAGEGPYAEMVREARRHRRRLDGGRMDWVVVRNRISVPASRHQGRVREGLEQLAARLGFRCVDGLADRLIYRELFPRGLSALDALDSAPASGPAGEPVGVESAAECATARHEVTRLIEGLKLPLDERGRRRASARHTWFAAQASPLEVHDLIES